MFNASSTACPVRRANATLAPLPMLQSPTRRPLDGIFEYVDANAERFVTELCDYVRQRSQTGHMDEIRECGQYTVQLLEQAGFTARIIEVDELAPIIYAECAGPP